MWQTADHSLPVNTDGQLGGFDVLPGLKIALAELFQMAGIALKPEAVCERAPSRSTSRKHRAADVLVVAGQLGFNG